MKISASDNPKLIGYAGANWSKDRYNSKSTSGFLSLYGSNVINWASRKQSIICESTAEAECVSAQGTCTEAEWIIQLLKDFRTDDSEQICLRAIKAAWTCTKCMGLCQNKSVALKCHLMRDMQRLGLIKLEYCPTEETITDILTKRLDVQESM